MLIRYVHMSFSLYVPGYQPSCSTVICSNLCSSCSLRWEISRERKLGKPQGSRERKLTPSRPGRSCATTCPWSRSLLPCRFGAFLGLRVRMGAADPVSSFRAWLSFYCLVAGSKPRLRGQANSIRTAQLGFGRCLRHNQFASARLLLVHVIRERTFCGRTGLPAQVILAHVGSIRCARHERWPGSWHSGFYPLP